MAAEQFSVPENGASDLGNALTEDPGPACSAVTMSSTEQEQEEKGAQAECRICLMSDALSEVVAPCNCTGTLEYAHLLCLKRWVGEQSALVCEICRSPYSEKLLPVLEGCIKARIADPSTAASEPAAEPESSRRCVWTILALVCPFAVVMLLVLIGTFTGQAWGTTALKFLAFGLPIIVIFGVIFNVVFTIFISKRRRERASPRQHQNPSAAEESQSRQAAPSVAGSEQLDRIV